MRRTTLANVNLGGEAILVIVANPTIEASCGPIADPVVTIAIPTFNRAALLRGCVAAALAQSYQRFEVLVSDNASVDETAKILTEFDDQRLRVVKQERNIGLVPNWNACLAEARGDYI